MCSKPSIIWILQAEYHDIAARRLVAEEAPGEQRRRQRQRIMAVAIAVFGDEQIVPDQQRIHHRSRRDVEGLEQEGADDQRDDEGMNDDPDGLADAALFALFFTGHAHWPLSFVCRTPARIGPRFRRAFGLPARSAR
jgi:hypothetical protein